MCQKYSRKLRYLLIFFQDMGNLILEVLAEGYVPIGVATVPNLQKLNAQSNING